MVNVFVYENFNTSRRTTLATPHHAVSHQLRHILTTPTTPTTPHHTNYTNYTTPHQLRHTTLYHTNHTTQGDKKTGFMVVGELEDCVHFKIGCTIHYPLQFIDFYLFKKINLFIHVFIYLFIYLFVYYVSLLSIFIFNSSKKIFFFIITIEANPDKRWKWHKSLRTNRILKKIKINNN